jgi:hypothetical protein
MNFIIYTMHPFQEGKKFFSSENDLNEYLKYLYSLLPNIKIDNFNQIPKITFAQFLENHIHVLKINMEICKKYSKIFQSNPRQRKNVFQK